MTFDHINNARQNHIELVVRDLVPWGIPPFVVREVLRWRGVAKWLAVRRLLITLKSKWKVEIALAHAAKREAKRARDWKRYHRLIGREEAYAECRQQVRVLCHMQRDVEWPTSPHWWPPESQLPPQMPACPNKRWLARFWGKTPA